jgi:hypothetical protein
MPLVLDGEIDPMLPEIILYEPIGNGQVRLTGADYLVFADAWDKKHSSSPELMGQKFQQFERRTGSGCRGSTRCTCGRGRTTHRLVRELEHEQLV